MIIEQPNRSLDVAKRNRGQLTTLASNDISSQGGNFIAGILDAGHPTQGASFRLGLPFDDMQHQSNQLAFQRTFF